MKPFTVAAMLFSFAFFSPVHAQTTDSAHNSRGAYPMLNTDDIGKVSPALAKHMQDTLQGEVWKRSEMNMRDRSLVTVASLIARGQTVDMPQYFNLALDNGVTPGELSEVITHLAFYSGWSNAMSAIVVAKEVFEKRGVTPEQLPAASGNLLPLDEEAEAKRAASVEQQVGPVVPGLVKYTSEVLFHDLWLRPGLSPRDRSMVTVSALITSGHFAQVNYHLNRAMDNGLTQQEAAEIVTHLAFYAGWPNAFSTVPVAKDVFENRNK
ncbi:carboxymuconolactone decarboxylase family protein [Hohaiivirga grylli]